MAGWESSGAGRKRLRVAADPGHPRPGRRPRADRRRAHGRAARQRRLQARSRPARPRAHPGAADRRRRDRERRPARRSHRRDPEVSIIVPLYERIDLIEHQLAQFWQDPDFHAAELIYVLDSPAAQGAARAARGSPARALRASLQGARAEPQRRLLDREQPGRRAGPGTAPAAAQLRRAAGRARLALEAARVLRRDASDRRARAEASLRGRVDPARGHVLRARSPSTRHWENQHYFKGFSRSLARGQRQPPRARGDRRLPDGRAGALRPGRAGCPRSTCRAATRTPTCACG